MRYRAGALAALVTALLSIFSASPASASPSDAQSIINYVLQAPNPKVAHDSLSSHDRAIFDSHMFVSKVVVTLSPAPGVHPLVSGCFNGRASGSGQNVFGGTLYTFWVDGEWCMNSSSVVTSATYLGADGETKTPGWRYEGVRSHGSGVLSGANFGLVWAHHLFVLGAGGVDVQHADECIRLIGISNGQASADSVCSSITL